MHLEKPIVILLILYTVIEVFFGVSYLSIPYWIRYGEFPDVFEFSNTLMRLFRILAHVLTFIGIFKLVRSKTIELLPVFKFPIYFFVAGSIFWFIASSLSSKYSFFLLHENARWYLYIYKLISLALLAMIFIHFLKILDLLNKIN